MVFMLSSNKLTSSTYTNSWCVPLNSKPNWFSRTFLMAYYNNYTCIQSGKIFCPHSIVSSQAVPYLPSVVEGHDYEQLPYNGWPDQAVLSVAFECDFTGCKVSKFDFIRLYMYIRLELVLEVCQRLNKRLRWKFESFVNELLRSWLSENWIMTSLGTR
jgi:hypothetical protein